MWNIDFFQHVIQELTPGIQVGRVFSYVCVCVIAEWSHRAHDCLSQRTHEGRSRVAEVQRCGHQQTRRGTTSSCKCTQNGT